MRSIAVSSLVPLVLLAVSPAQTPVLWDHGPLVTHARAGAGGLDVSALDNSGVFHPAHNVYGFGAQWVAGAGISLADDFTVCGTWAVSEVEVFGYTTNAAPPIFTGVYVQIWNGDPRQWGSQVIRGDLYTNLLTAAPAGVFHCYRTLIGGLTATNRAVQAVRVPVRWAPLPPGTYWFEYQLQGANFVPPVTEREVYATGDAIQRQTATWVVLNNAALPNTAGVAVPIRFYGTGGIDARQGIYGEAKPGSGGRPAWGVCVPVPGRDLNLQIFNGVPGQVPVVMIGFGRTDIAVPPIGRAFTLPIVTLAMPPFDGNGVSAMRLPVPHGVCAGEVDFQGVWFDSGAAGGIGHTGGMAAMLGGTGGESYHVEVNVKVGKTQSFSLGMNSTDAVIQSNSHPNVATATTGARRNYWEVNVTGVSAGVTVIIVNYKDNAGNKKTARFWVTVKS